MIRNTSNLQYAIPTEIKDEQKTSLSAVDSILGTSLLEFLHTNTIGNGTTFKGPFGARRIVYSDWAASGRGLKFINDYISEEVLPWYANTHSMANATATQISMLREEARQIVRHTVNANSDKDSVIFHGNGTTGVTSLLRHIIDAPSSIFLVGEEAHHSLYTPWRDETENVLLIPDSPDREQWVGEILSRIRAVNKEVPVFGCFGRVSNVTGAVFEIDRLAAVLHQYGAFIVVDYASGAPYLPMDMNPTDGVSYKDAIVFSPHKFLGGVESPGVLVVKKELFRAARPMVSGGGTVFYVKEDGTTYFKAPELREEGGTPNILGSIRAGLACFVKLRAVGAVTARVNARTVERFRAMAAETPNIILLRDRGDSTSSTDHVPIFSFLIRHHDLFLHHNFVVVLLNDLFGIQSRGGCLCAGPYVQRLLGIDTPLNNRLLALLSEDPNLDRHHLRRTREYSSYEVFRPGVVRVSLSYTAPEAEVEFVVRAVQMIAEEGWRLLPFYRCNSETGEWQHLNNLQFSDRRWLAHIKLTEEGVKWKEFPSDPAPGFEECLEGARNVFRGIKSYKAAGSQDGLFAEYESLRWFLLPSDVVAEVNHSKPPTTSSPFRPGSLEICPVVAEKRKETLEQILRFCRPKPAPSQQPVSEERSEAISLVRYLVKLIGSFIWGAPELPWQQPVDRHVTTGHVTATHVTAPAVKDVNGTGEGKPTSGLETKPKKKPVQACKVPKVVTGKVKWHHPTKGILKPMVRAIDEFGMIQDGDRVLVCLSGGKDSLSMLHALRQYQFIARKKGVSFEMGAVTVDPMTPTYNPAPLIPYLAELGLEYLFERQGILAKAEETAEQIASICSYCSRMKRGRIYAAARRHNYNVIALGQHLDDLSESFFMSVFHNGLLRTMKAHYRVTEDDLRVIRPLLYVRERELRSFAESRALPVIAENCPACFEEPKERHRVKQLLAQQELLFPRLASSLQRAMKPLYSKNRVGLESRPLPNGTCNPTVLQTPEEDDGESGDEMFPQGC